MKHTRRLAACALALLIPLCLASTTVRAHDDDLADPGSGAGPVEGAWRLVSPSLGPGVEEYKYIVGGRFTWIVVDGGRIVRGGAGRAAMRGGRYVERIDSVLTEDLAWMVGGTATIEVGGDRGRWRHRGVIESGDRRFEIDEVWERSR